jgi:hypothetical protein
MGAEPPWLRSALPPIEGRRGKSNYLLRTRVLSVHLKEIRHSRKLVFASIRFCVRGETCKNFKETVKHTQEYLQSKYNKLYTVSSSTGFDHWGYPQGCVNVHILLTFKIVIYIPYQSSSEFNYIIIFTYSTWAFIYCIFHIWTKYICVDI